MKQIKISILALCAILTIAAGAVKSQTSLDYAYSLLNQGDTVGAISLFESETINNPGNTQIQLQLAYIYTSQKNYPKAVEYFQNVVNNSSDETVVADAKKSIAYLNSFSLAGAYVREAYNSLNQGDTLLAISLFEQSLKTEPSVKTYMQLGYLYTSIRNYAKARESFQYVENNSTDIDEVVNAKKSLISLDLMNAPGNNNYTGTATVLDRAYTKLNEGKKTEAIALFEEYLKTNPADNKVRMQLGYLYTDRSNYTKAKEYFNYVAANSTNQSEIKQAKDAARTIDNRKFRVSSRSSIDLYFYNTYDTFQENYISNFLGRYNFLIVNHLYTGLYTDVYLDSRSRSDLILNDRYVEVGGFLRVAPADWVSLELRAGYVREIDKNLNSFNYKPILTFAKRFGNAPVVKTKYTKQENFYLDTYSAFLYDHKFRNFFAQGDLREVLRFMTGGSSYMDFYLRQQATIDSKKLDYNNYGEFGGGIAFAPVKNFPEIFIEATNKVYFQQSRPNSFQVKVGFLLTYFSPL